MPKRKSAGLFSTPAPARPRAGRGGGGGHASNQGDGDHGGGGGGGGGGGSANNGGDEAPGGQKKKKSRAQRSSPTGSGAGGGGGEKATLGSGVGLQDALRAKKRIVPAMLRTLLDPAQNLRFRDPYVRFECVARLVAVQRHAHQTLMTFDDSSAVAVLSADPGATRALEKSLVRGDGDGGTAGVGVGGASSDIDLPRAVEGDALDDSGTPGEGVGGDGGGGDDDGDGQPAKQPHGRSSTMGGGDTAGKRSSSTGGDGQRSSPTGNAADGAKPAAGDDASPPTIPLNVYYVVFGELVGSSAHSTLAVRVVRRVTDPNRIVDLGLRALREHLLWTRSPEYAMNRSAASVRVDLAPQKELASLDSYRLYQTLASPHLPPLRPSPPSSSAPPSAASSAAEAPAPDDASEPPPSMPVHLRLPTSDPAAPSLAPASVVAPERIEVRRAVRPPPTVPLSQMSRS